MCAVLLSHPYNREVDFVVPPIHNPWWTPLHTLAGLLLHFSHWAVEVSLQHLLCLHSHIFRVPLNSLLASCPMLLSFGCWSVFPSKQVISGTKNGATQYRLVHLPVLHHIPLSHSPTPFTNLSQFKQVISGTKYGVTQV